jgi:hypothetical protein
MSKQATAGEATGETSGASTGKRGAPVLRVIRSAGHGR